MIKYRANVTNYENGKIVINPEQHTGVTRYESVIEMEYGEISRTKNNYRLLLNVSRKNSLERALALMTEDLNRAFANHVPYSDLQ